MRQPRDPLLGDGTGKDRGDVPDRLFSRLFQPWTLPESEWPLCKEDWSRVDAICDLPWTGRVLDFGSGDGTLAAMVCARNPLVMFVDGIDTYPNYRARTQWAKSRMLGRWSRIPALRAHYDCALCCEVLEHLTPEEGHAALVAIKAVLKPKGFLCVTVPYRGGSRAIYPGHIRTFSKTSLMNDVRAAGFRGVSEYTIAPYAYPIWICATARA